MLFQDKLHSKLFTTQSITNVVKTWKEENKKIVFTNGCFDILHKGHVEYLSRARDLGDKLIIGLNTDNSVKQQGKAPNRPINNEEARAILLSALECVDAVIYFEEQTP